MKTLRHRKSFQRIVGKARRSGKNSINLTDTRIPRSQDSLPRTLWCSLSRVRTSSASPM
jgi:hypothetical protein